MQEGIFDREMVAYQCLKAKLKAIAQDSNAHPELSSQPFNDDSKNHHYIPKHFIDGFLNNDGLLWRYDKQRDRIVKNPTGSKGVFFKQLRNSVLLSDGSTSPLFEHAYSVNDNIFPHAIKLLRRPGLEAEDVNELYTHLNIFLIDLYWRNINTDKTFDQIYERMLLHATTSGRSGLTNAEINELKTTPGYQQLTRLHIVPQCMEVAKRYIESGVEIHQSLVEYNIPQFCLGDMPYLMPVKPTRFDNLVGLPMIMPISSNKIYIRNIQADRTWDAREASMINVLIIDQSSEMVVCADKGILELAISTYKAAKQLDALPELKQHVLRSLNANAA